MTVASGTRPQSGFLDFQNILPLMVRNSTLSKRFMPIKEAPDFGVLILLNSFTG